MASYENDSRVVMTLDAGGTSFRFSAVRGNQLVTPTITLPSNADNLDRCLGNLVEGFTLTQRRCPTAPVAVSFAFPGPADYLRGIIGDLPNLPAFRGGVALGPMLADKFSVPVFINNDGDLFTYGEAIAGFLPHINGLLEKAGSPKRFKNLFGVTLGTGFGGGIVRDGDLFLGDNCVAGEVWLLRHKTMPGTNAEEGASIRAVRRAYAAKAGLNLSDVPEPKVISDISLGITPGNQGAAQEAFRELGTIVGDAMGAALTLIDGLAVVGGGLSGAWPLFLPALVDELNSSYTSPNGNPFPRLASRAFNLQDQNQLETFVHGDTREIRVPGNGRVLKYDALSRVGVGISQLGTSTAISLGAYAFALHTLDRKQAVSVPNYPVNSQSAVTAS